MMKMKLSVIILILIFSVVYAEYEEYKYHRKIEDVKETWHKIDLPNGIIQKLKPDLTDVRIIGVDPEGIMFEAPYILTLTEEKHTSSPVHFKLINQTKNANGYYYTFKTARQDLLEEIELTFKNENFDWRINLEGSHNQKQWFTVLQDYRILSLKNQHTDYSFTTLKFPAINYSFIRLYIPGNIKPQITAAYLKQQSVSDGRYEKYSVQNQKIENEPQTKQTVVNLTINETAPVSYIKINIRENYNYLRPVTIKYLTDSVVTQKGVRYYYRTLDSSYLSSLEKNIFKFENTVLQRLKIIISNQDNEPLNIDSIIVKGNVYQLTGRFDQTAKYFLYYHNPSAPRPQYDIGHFANNIPANPAKLALGPEVFISSQQTETPSPLFMNQAWLWIIMIVIVAFLGWYTLRMVKQKSAE